MPATTATTEPLYLRPRQVRQMTGLSNSGVMKLVWSGQLRSKKQGRAILIDAASVRAYFDALPSGEKVA